MFWVPRHAVQNDGALQFQVSGPRFLLFFVHVQECFEIINMNNDKQTLLAAMDDSTISRGAGGQEHDCMVKLCAVPEGGGGAVDGRVCR